MSDLLKTLCSVPTAPFAEHRVIDFAPVRRGTEIPGDEAGSLWESAHRIEIAIPPAAVGFTAHMDHPGFIARKMLDDRTLRADFRGWVKVDFVQGTRVRFFDDAGEAAGVVTQATVADYDQRAVPHEVTVRISRPVAPGSPGMFDQGVGRYVGGKFFCRGCDDLGGASACLAMLDRLKGRKLKSPVAVLLTRAEEEGFIGCIAACEHRTLLRGTDRVIAIECSSEQPVARQGDGVIIRVGDRASIFNSALTYFLGQQADELKKNDRAFRHQRALMPGGVCEATVYDVYGYTAASLCVAQGNYHNMDVKRKKIGPEYIDRSDWQNMVKLFVRLAEHGHQFKPGHAALRARVLKRFKKLQRFLAE